MAKNTIWRTFLSIGLFQIPDNVSAPKSYFVFVVFATKMKGPIILKMI